MHPDGKIERWEREYVYIYIRVAHLLFRNLMLPHYHNVAQVAFWAEVSLGLVEVHPCLCASSVSADALLCQFGMEGSHPSDFLEPLPGVFLSQCSLCYAQGTQLPAPSLLRHRCKDSWQRVVFSLLWSAIILLRPFWPYSWQGACWTVVAVPDLLTLPKYLTCWKRRRN